MKNINCVYPNINEGRFFVSPIIGCSGGCDYCYLQMKNYSSPRKNELTYSDFLSIAQQSPDFKWGINGTIISVGAWGDIFPLNNDELIRYSIQFIKNLLHWGNPVQIMSKNTINETFIKEIVDEVCYKGQLLYSTTITTLNHWKNIEFGTASPIKRLETCELFSQLGIPTNVLLKPFIPNLTDVEIDRIVELLLKYHIDFCTVGIMYVSTEIREKICNNSFLYSKLKSNSFSEVRTLDCNGNILLSATSVNDIRTYISYLRSQGLEAFLKSSCVNSNVLHIPNPSNYQNQDNSYCIRCGNCNKDL